MLSVVDSSWQWHMYTALLSKPVAMTGFEFGSYILSFRFDSVLYEFGCLTILNLTVPQ